MKRRREDEGSPTPSKRVRLEPADEPPPTPPARRVLTQPSRFIPFQELQQLPPNQRHNIPGVTPDAAFPQGSTYRVGPSFEVIPSAPRTPALPRHIYPTSTSLNRRALVARYDVIQMWGVDMETRSPEYIEYYWHLMWTRPAQSRHSPWSRPFWTLDSAHLERRRIFHELFWMNALYWMITTIPNFERRRKLTLTATTFDGFRRSSTLDVEQSWDNIYLNIQQLFTYIRRRIEEIAQIYRDDPAHDIHNAYLPGQSLADHILPLYTHVQLRIQET